MWACCLKPVYEQLGAERVEEFPLRPRSPNDHSSRDNQRQKSLRAQLAKQRPGPLHAAGPILPDSPTNTAGVPFNLLPSSLLSLTSPLNSRLVPPGGSGICFACTCSGLPCIRSAHTGGESLALFQPGCFIYTEGRIS